VRSTVRWGSFWWPLPADEIGDALKPGLSVVLVSWNGRKHTEACLSSLTEHSSHLRLEFIVVDNASGDGSAAAIRELWPQATLIQNDQNVGFSRASNQGMRAASADFILLLNPDTYVLDDVLGRAVDLMTRRSEMGMLGCRLAYPDGRLQHTANRALSIRRTLFERLWLYKLLPADRRPRALLGGYWSHDEEAEVDWLAGAFMLLRRELFEASGGFDERFFMYGEDSEWCMRLRRMGYRIFFSPDAGTVFHIGSVSSDAVWTEKERLRLCHVGGLESYEAVHGRAMGFGYRMAEVIGAAARFAAYSLIAAVCRTEYFRHQARSYRWLVEFYAVPHRRVSRPGETRDRRRGCERKPVRSVDRIRSARTNR
jgi:GT2 family glycosyltransferase